MIGYEPIRIKVLYFSHFCSFAIKKLIKKMLFISMLSNIQYTLYNLHTNILGIVRLILDRN